jgi:hypothetical protein
MVEKTDAEPPDPARREPDPALRDHEALLAVADAFDGDRAGPLTALRQFGLFRAHVDDLERRLIESARDNGASWAHIAGALGLSTRQAAEQRWLRLSGGVTRNPADIRVTRQRQRSVDTIHGPEIGRLRTAVLAFDRRLRADPEWDERFARAELVRSTIAMAATAAPGALFSLTAQAVSDLYTPAIPDLPAPIRAAADKLRAVLLAATPTS